MQLTFSVLAVLIGASAVIPPRECDPELVQMCVDKLKPKLDACQDEMRCECNIVITEAASCYASCPQDNITEFIKGYKGGKCAMFDPNMYARAAEADINDDAFRSHGIRPPSQRGGVRLDIDGQSPNVKHYVDYKWKDPASHPHYAYGQIPEKRDAPAIKIHSNVDKMSPVFVFDYEKGEYTVLQQNNAPTAKSEVNTVSQPNKVMAQVQAYKPVTTVDNRVQYTVATIFTTVTAPNTFLHNHNYNYHFKVVAKPAPAQTTSPSPINSLSSSPSSSFSSPAVTTRFGTPNTRKTVATTAVTGTKHPQTPNKKDIKKTGLTVATISTAAPYTIRTHYITTNRLNVSTIRPQTTSSELSPEDISRLAHKSYLRELRKKKSTKTIDNEVTKEPETSTSIQDATVYTTVGTLRKLEPARTPVATTPLQRVKATETSPHSRVVMSGAFKPRPHWLLLLLALI